MNGICYCKATRCADTEQSRAAALDENPLNANSGPSGGRKKRGFAPHSKLWKPGRTLHMAFFGEVAPEVQEAVVAVCDQWLEHANLTLELITDTAQAEVRVMMKPSGSVGPSAEVGTDALTIAADMPTLTMPEWPGDENFEAAVLHEFGHVLGLEHEHQHPDANIPWDEPKLYEGLLAYGWDKQTVDENFLTRFDATLAAYGPYDPDSVMHYAVENQFTVGDWERPSNFVLSDGDKAFIRQAYPATAE
ncbi:peptidase M12 [Pseudomonas silvicola]|nr:peptidase M12 [Pseudomonas silvicola]